MSQHRHEQLTCPKCGTRGEFVIWDSINADTDPELKEKLLDESLFAWTCPHCGHKAYITYGTLYHDPTAQFMLFFDHKADETDIEEDSFPDEPAFEQFNKTYKLRYVHGILPLKEKIFIFEEGLSDIVIELIKYFIRNGIVGIRSGETPEDSRIIEPNHFIGRGIWFTDLSEDGEQLVFTVTSPKGSVEKRFGISMDIYQQCLQKLVIDKRFKEEKNTIKHVCYDWIDAKMKKTDDKD